MNDSVVRRRGCSRRSWCSWKRGMSLCARSISDPPLGHPRGRRATDTRAFLDPDRSGRPQALHGALAEDRRAVTGQREEAVDGVADLRAVGTEQVGHELVGLLELGVEVVAGEGDRKSTRLNSSHGYISYAVFCL